MGGVERLVCGVELVEHRADERGLADVLGNADALRVGGERDRRVGLVSEADRGRVESHGRDSTRGPAGGPRERSATATIICGSVVAIAVAR